MYFFGVDLAWTRSNPTGFCALEGDETGVRVVACKTLRTDDEIADAVVSIAGPSPASIAIDAPLLVPNLTGRRPAEAEIGQTFIQQRLAAYSANRTFFLKTFSCIRGEDLVAKLHERGFVHNPLSGGRRVFEVYPHSILIGLFQLDRALQYKKGRLANRRPNFHELQKQLASLEGFALPLSGHECVTAITFDSVKGKQRKELEDKLDALVCAYFAAYARYYPQACTVLGNLKEGYIYSPTPDERVITA